MPDRTAHDDLLEPPNRSARGRPVDRLLAAIRTLGLVGRVVFIHSAWSSLKPLRIEPLEFLKLLCEAIGPRGTLVMPAYPMTGFSQAYLESNPVFDWEQTPSRTGLLTELLRSMSGSERSLHPTHSVTARGALARWITDGHARSETPFDRHSPFRKMYDCDAVVVNLGVHLMTFRHLADHRLKAELPHPVYAERIVRVKMIDRERRVSWTETRGHNPEYKVDYRHVVQRLGRSGDLVSLRLAGVPVDVIPVRSFVDSYCRAFRDGDVSFIRREAGDVDAGPVAWS
jgi:aminoglycoside 3-N-acetyltransferase